MEDNPFQAPASDRTQANREGHYHPEGHYHVEDGLLVMSRFGVALPERCVKCNQPTEKRYSKILSWSPKWVALTLLACWPLFFATYFYTRRAVVVDVGLCETHSRRSLLLLGSGFVVFLVWFFALVSGVFVTENLLFLSFAVMFVVVVVFALKARVLWAVKVEEDIAYFKGASEIFLESL